MTEKISGPTECRASTHQKSSPQFDATLINDTVVEFIRQQASAKLAEFPRVKRWEDTGDITQLAAERLLKAICKKRPTDVEHVKSLAVRQIRFTLLTLARDLNRRQVSHHTPTRIDTGYVRHEELAADAELPAEHAETWGRLHDAIADLPQEERNVFELMWYCEFQRREVAEWLGLSRDQVQRRFSSAREKLMPLLLELDFEDS